MDDTRGISTRWREVQRIGFEIQRRRVTAADGGSVVTECVLTFLTGGSGCEAA